MVNECIRWVDLLKCVRVCFVLNCAGMSSKKKNMMVFKSIFKSKSGILSSFLPLASASCTAAVVLGVCLLHVI